MLLSLLHRHILVWVSLGVLIVVLIARCYVYCKNRDKNTDNTSVGLCKVITVTNSSFAVILFALLGAIQQTIAGSFEELHNSHDYCAISTVFGIFALVLHKLALHTFAVMRLRLVQIHESPLWFKMGVPLLSSDLLLILFIIFRIDVVIKGMFAHCEDCHEHIPQSIYIWYAINDFVIGTFCLFGFVIALLKLIKEQNEAFISDPMYKNTIIKVSIWTTMAIVSTMITTGLSFGYVHDADAILRLDSVLNSICVLMNFVKRKEEKVQRRVVNEKNTKGRRIELEMATNMKKTKKEAAEEGV